MSKTRIINASKRIPKRQSRETGNIGYIRRRQITKTQHNICFVTELIMIDIWY